jgi:hypothetical protein
MFVTDEQAADIYARGVSPLVRAKGKIGGQIQGQSVEGKGGPQGR